MDKLKKHLEENAIFYFLGGLAIALIGTHAVTQTRTRAYVDWVESSISATTKTSEAYVNVMLADLKRIEGLIPVPTS